MAIHPNSGVEFDATDPDLYDPDDGTLKADGRAFVTVVPTILPGPRTMTKYSVEIDGSMTQDDLRSIILDGLGYSKDIEENPSLLKVEKL